MTNAEKFKQAFADEELKENGINIPKKRITNRDRLAKMNNQELAEEICANQFYFDCSSCPGLPQCDYGDNKSPVGDGLIKWLEAEEEA